MRLRKVKGILTFVVVVLALWTKPSAFSGGASAGLAPSDSQPPETPVPTAASVPSTTPVVAASSTPLTVSAPIVVTTDDRTIENVAITSVARDGVAIRAWGTAEAPIRNLTIRNCRIDGFGSGIDARFVVNLVVENCVVEDAAYAGIIVYSGVGGRIADNQIRRIGVGIDLHGPDDNNAYGIALSRIGTPSLATDPRTSGFVVERNTVEDVPLWHGIDTHAGSSITIRDNVVRGCPRAIFITVDRADFRPESIVVTQNRLENAVAVPGGTNTTAITLVNLQGGSITDNVISTTYPEPFVYDYLGLDPAGSINVKIAGQRAIP